MNSSRAGETMETSAAGRGTSCSPMAATSASSAPSSVRKALAPEGAGRTQAASATVAVARMIAVHW